MRRPVLPVLLSLCLMGGLLVSVNRATAQPVHAPEARPTRAQELAWAYVSRTPAVPGTLLDGSPANLQDDSLNSSFVVRVTSAGQPVRGARVTWRTSDRTARITALTATTDASGKARMWYFAGRESVQRITATNEASGQALTVNVRVAPVIEPTVGRYVALYFDAPPTMEAAGSDQAYAVTATPHTAPTRTYYQFITAWQAADPSQVSFYGGIQNFDCADEDSTMDRAICSSERKGVRGRLAIFSAWNTTDAQGQVLRPVIAHLPDTSSCADFTGEGEGLKCTAALDWRIGRSLIWKVEKLPGATSPAQRVRSSVSLDGGATLQEIATFDVPVNPSFTTIAPFVEHWGGDPAATCLDVALRHLTINAFGFYDGQTWQRPAPWAVALGDLYGGTATACENYSITATPDGLSVRSGGLNNWLDLKPVLAWNPDGLVRGQGFASLDQARYPWQAIDISTVD